MKLRHRPVICKCSLHHTSCTDDKRFIFYIYVPYGLTASLYHCLLQNLKENGGKMAHFRLKGFMKWCNAPPGQSHSYNIKKWAHKNEHIRPILPRCYKGERAPPGDVSNPIALNVFSADSTRNGNEWEKLIKMDIAVLFFYSIHWPVTHTLAGLKDSCKGTVSNSTSLLYLQMLLS